MGENKANWSALAIVRANLVQLWWAFEHWTLTKVFKMAFCYRCSGYFYEIATLHAHGETLCANCWVLSAEGR